VIECLLREPGPVDVSWVYAESGASLQDLHRLADLGLLILGESQVWRDPLQDVSPILTAPPELTRDQQTCWREIQKGLLDVSAGLLVSPFLLHG
jgi:hypothetical protein